MKLYKLSVLILFLFLLISCSPQMSITIAPDDTVFLEYKSETDEIITDLLSSITGSSKEDSLFDTKVINNNLTNSGLSVQSVDSINSTDFSFVTGPDPIQKIITAIPNVIPYSNNDLHKVNIVFSPVVIQNILKLMPEETASYAELLMAPILSGEEMTKAEYIDLLSIIYGDEVSKKMASSKMTFRITVPGVITELEVPSTYTSKSNPNQKTVELSIFVADFLSSINTNVISIIWK